MDKGVDVPVVVRLVIVVPKTVEVLLVDVGLSSSWTRLLTCRCCASGGLVMLSAHRPALGRGCRRARCCARLGLLRHENCAVAAHRRGLSRSLDKVVDVLVVVHVFDVGGGLAGAVHRQGFVQLLDEVIDVPVFVHVQGPDV